jgi:hypothetical protein
MTIDRLARSIVDDRLGLSARRSDPIGVYSRLEYPNEDPRSIRTRLWASALDAAARRRGTRPGLKARWLALFRRSGLAEGTEPRVDPEPPSRRPNAPVGAD